jgi:para-nitrobenzyl esterase
VTIAGESAGGRNVLILLISPKAKGLFHRAIVQSGRANTTPTEDGEAQTVDLLQKLLMNDGTAADEAAARASLEDMSKAEIASYLRSKTSQEIMACFSLGPFGSLAGFLSNFADGDVIPEKEFKTFVDGTYPNKVPIILGTTKEEMKLFMFSDPYFKDEDDLYQAAASFLSDMWKVVGVDDIARKISSHADQPPVYAYQFLWGAGGDKGKSVIPDPWGFKLGSCHIMEIPFFLANERLLGPITWTLITFTEKNRPGRIALSEAMVTYLAQFVRTGYPNPPDSELPKWSPWTNEEGGPKCILLDADYEQAIIKMSNEELTEEKVKAGLDQLEDRLSKKLKEYLAGRR